MRRKLWLVLHKESKQAEKMQHPEKLNQEAKDKTFQDNVILKTTTTTTTTPKSIQEFTTG
jgi:hypothetical protein